VCVITKFYSDLSDNVFKIPESVPPADCSDEITVFGGDCNNPIISPINSSLDLRELMLLQKLSKNLEKNKINLY
jgi:hypothetical protein